MKTYTLDLKTAVVLETTTPSWGVLHDSPRLVDEQNILLSEHFSDIHLLFLSKVVRLGLEATLDEQEQKKLTALFEEMMKVKLLLQKND